MTKWQRCFQCKIFIRSTYEYFEPKKVQSLRMSITKRMFFFVASIVDVVNAIEEISIFHS